MKKISMTHRKRILIPIGAGLLGSIFLTATYFGIVSLVESSKHANEFFWQDRWIVIPIILGFGVQSALFSILKLKLYLPLSYFTADESINPARVPGASMGASGSTSTIAMVACCTHHVTDVLPILGLTAAATFLAKYRLAFMGIGLGTTVIGIIYMLMIIIRERRRVIQSFTLSIPEAGITCRENYLSQHWWMAKICLIKPAASRSPLKVLMRRLVYLPGN